MTDEQRHDAARAGGPAPWQSRDVPPGRPRNRAGDSRRDRLPDEPREARDRRRPAAGRDDVAPSRDPAGAAAPAPGTDDDEPARATQVRGPLVRECHPRELRTSGQLAAVLLYRSGGYRVRWPGRREDHDKPVFARPYTAFEVYTGRKVTTFRLSLPAAGGAEHFEATARVHWEVTDPYAVVRNGVWDAADLLGDELLALLRGVTRRYALTEAERADEAVRDTLAARGATIGEDLGLRTDVHVYIDLSRRVVGMLREHQQQERQMQLVRDRSREFERVLRSGDLTQIAYFMARDPEKALEIRNLIRAERREEQGDWIELINRLLDSGHLERHDIGEQMYEVLQLLRRGSTGVVASSLSLGYPDAGRPRPQLDGPPERAPRARRPFWEDDDRQGGERQGDDRDGDTGRDAGRDVGEPRRPHEPTRVESGADRADRAARAARRDDDPYRRDDDPYRRPGRVSDRFSDWGDDQ